MTGKSQAEEKTPVPQFDYTPFLSTPNAKQWTKLGLQRRAGVSVPLFSIYSRESIGLGELPDLKLLGDWCRKTGMSLIQLLPMNDTGFNFTPYDAQSSFALDPVYLAVGELSGIAGKTFRDAVDLLRRKFPAGGERVDYGVKKAKLELLWKIFQGASNPADQTFARFRESNQYWLEDYALFKVIKEGYQETRWEDWPEDLKHRNPQALQHIKDEHAARLLFHQWLQWQLFEQFRDARRYLQEKNIFLMGDLPFLVSRDSADVWAHQACFKLELSSGAPPDAFFAKGQRWGMPPYDWPVIESRGYDYLIEKIKYSEHFYDLFRIDHVVGTFRLWTIPLSEPRENHGLNGFFDPSEEWRWEEHGKKLLSVMSGNSSMLACAEDLGVIPDCCPKVLWEFAIPGMDVQRWTKEWHADASFRKPENYRKNSIAVISNHDMSSFRGWWAFEAGTVDEELFTRKCGEKNLPFDLIREKLFDAEKCRFGRLRWKDEISHGEMLCGILGRSAEEIGDFIEMHKGSYGEKQRFWEFVGLAGSFEEKASTELILRAMTRASESASIFSIQLLQDLLDLGPLFEHDDWTYRINFPGSMGAHNWSLVIPVSLEEMNQSKLNGRIRQIHLKGSRV